MFRDENSSILLNVTCEHYLRNYVIQIMSWSICKCGPNSFHEINRSIKYKHITWSPLILCSMTVQGRIVAEARLSLDSKSYIFIPSRARRRCAVAVHAQASAGCVRRQCDLTCADGRARRTAARRGTPPPSTTQPRSRPRSQVCTTRITRPNTSTPTSLTRSGPPRRTHTTHTHHTHGGGTRRPCHQRPVHFNHLLRCYIKMSSPIPSPVPCTHTHTHDRSVVNYSRIAHTLYTILF